MPVICPRRVAAQDDDELRIAGSILRRFAARIRGGFAIPRLKPGATDPSPLTRRGFPNLAM